MLYVILSKKLISLIKFENRITNICFLLLNQIFILIALEHQKIFSNTSLVLSYFKSKYLNKMAIIH